MRADRDWFIDAKQEVQADARTREALDRELDQKATQVRERMAQEKARLRRRLSAPITVEQFFDIAHWAKKLSFSEFTVRGMCRDGLIRAEKIRGQWRISESAIKEFLEAERRQRVS